MGTSPELPDVCILSMNRGTVFASESAIIWMGVDRPYIRVFSSFFTQIVVLTGAI